MAHICLSTLSETMQFVLPIFNLNYTQNIVACITKIISVRWDCIVVLFVLYLLILSSMTVYVIIKSVSILVNVILTIFQMLKSAIILAI